jgi:enoyl-CoA hydratase/carnithine racemase
MIMSALLTKIDEKQIATVTLNRPLIHNAIDDQLILELMNVLRDLEQKPQVRAVLLTANGASFCAGADLQWMKRMAAASQDENLRDAEQLAGVMRRLNIFPRPTVALVQGAAYGGGVGLVAACDVAVASEGATFSLSEVKLGLIPSVISPYVIAAMAPAPPAAISSPASASAPPRPCASAWCTRSCRATICCARPTGSSPRCWKAARAPMSRPRSWSSTSPASRSSRA